MAASIVERSVEVQGVRERAGRTVEAVRLANAVALVGLVAYFVCAAMSLVAPGVIPWIAQSWTHSLTLEPLRPAATSLTPGQFIGGMVTFTGFVWLVTAASVWVYKVWR